MKASSRMIALQLCSGSGRACSPERRERVKEVSEGEISRKTYAVVRLSDAFDHVKNSIMKCFMY